MEKILNKYTLIYDALSENEMMTVSDIEHVTGIRQSTIKNYLYLMRDVGGVYIALEELQKNGWTKKYWKLSAEPIAVEPKQKKKIARKRKKCLMSQVPKATNWLGGYVA